MKSLISDPIGAYLTQVIPSDSEDLTLTLIQKHLDDNHYSRSADWYADVCSIFEKMIADHKSDEIVKMSLYSLARFKKMSVGLDLSDSGEWFALVNKLMLKLCKIESESPVPQGIDPYVLNIIKKARSMLFFPSEKFPELCTRLSSVSSDDKFKHKLVFVLRELEPGFSVNSDSLSINVSHISPATANALWLLTNNC